MPALPAVLKPLQKLSLPGQRSSRDETESQQLYPQPVLDFTARVQEIKSNPRYIGIDGHGNKAHYIPYDELEKYWRGPQKNKTRKIEEISKAYKPSLVLKPEAVIQNLRLFSLLVYLDKAQYYGPAFLARSISDDRLPFTEIPPILDEPAYHELFEGIFKHQWMFCPLVLDYARLTNYNLDPRRLLPFKVEAELSSSRPGRSSQVLKIEVDESCNIIERSDTTLDNNIFVLKRYKNEEGKQAYRNEEKALTTLQQLRAKENIIGYFGSFIQNNTYNLLLEFADGGNLLQYLKNTPQPETPENVQRFWASLFRIFKGLHCIHQQKLSQDDPGGFRGIHQDIKPDNIFLKKSAENTPYAFCPVLGDFGHSDFIDARTDGEDDTGTYRGGNATYGAPECSHHAGYQMVPSRIRPEADIFSIGCVVSVAAAWVALGPAGLDEYRELRAEASAKVPNFKESGQQCFHNAVERSPSVDQMHNRIRETCQLHGDELTPQVLDLVEKHMLPRGDWRQRAQANEIWERYVQLQPASEIPPATEVQAQPTTKLSHQIRTALTSTFKTTTSSISNKLINRRMNGEISSLSPSLPIDEAEQDSPEECGITPATPAQTDHEHEPPLTPPSSEVDPISPKLPARPPRPQPHTIQVNQPQEIKDQSPLADQIPPSGPSPNPNGGFEFPSNPSSYYLSPASPLSPAPLVDIESIMKEHLALSEASAWKQKRKAYDQTDQKIYEIIRSLQQSIKGRDHIFFVDTSRTMGQWADAVAQAFETLAYIAKPQDSKAATLSLVIGKEIRVHSDTTPLTKVLQGCSYEQMGCFMEDNLSHLVEHEIIPKRLPPGPPPTPSSPPSKTRGRSPSRKLPNPLSLIVFTDGRWGDAENADGAVGVQNPIRRLVEIILERKLVRTQIMVQFIRFGEDEHGKRHLRYLAEFAKREGSDIVDTTSVEGKVCSMLIGSINENHLEDGGSYLGRSLSNLS